MLRLTGTLARWPVVFLLAACCAAVAIIANQEAADSLRGRAVASLATIDGEVRIAGLGSQVEVIRDRWGVPHIYASSTRDLFFAQGYVAAQDRLWQLDLWRRIAQGELSEVLGPSGLTRDRFARLLKFRRDIETELDSYAPGSRDIIKAFVDGVNARIDEVNGSAAQLPLEFQLTASRPERWTAETVVGRMAGYIMTRNARTEVQRARLAAAVGADQASLLMPTDPFTRLAVPPGLDLADIGDKILAVAAGSGETVDFSPLSRPAPALTGGGLLVRPGAAFARQSLPATSSDPGTEAIPWNEIGSNNWVVSGAKSATGKPLLATDPHRTIMQPSLRYTVHLVGPGWNVIGAGEPALPGVAAGHNERIAFGFTIVGMDQQDLYVERLNPEDHSRYLVNGEWLPLQVIRETIEVKGEAPREVELTFTRHGPVLHVDEARHRAYALRWVGAEFGAAGYLRSLSLDTAKNWTEFLAAVDGWKIPSENLAYADVDGNIGWIAAGASPVRRNWDGLLPVPGHEGRYEWDGFVPAGSLPRLFNPKSGVIATANHNILSPLGGPPLGFEFGAPYRFNRIMEVLMAGPETRTFSVADFERLQHDERSSVAWSLVQALRVSLGIQISGRWPEKVTVTGDVRRAAELLAPWDGTLARESAAAALYELWAPKVSRAMADAFVSPSDRPYSGASLSNDRLLAFLDSCRLASILPWADAWVDGSPNPRREAEWHSMMPPCTTAVNLRLRGALVGAPLGEAWAEATAKMGPDPSTWAWGRLHRVSFEHPLAFTPERKALLNAGDAPRGGDGTTPNSTGAGARQTHGASFRAVMDPSNWDHSTTINVPGASGQPASPHYADLLPLWAEGRYHPMVYSRAAVEGAAAHRLKLLPR